MEATEKKRNCEPVIICISDDGITNKNYIIRLYDNLVDMQGANLKKTLEVLIKLFAFLNIKPCKSIEMFKNFWCQSMGIEGQDKVTCSLMTKLKLLAPPQVAMENSEDI